MIYTYLLPIIGLVIPIVIILFGAILFGPKKFKEPEVFNTHVLLAPFKDAPWWTWIIAIIGYAPFVFHAIELWHPNITDTREWVDIAFMITIFFYFIACFVAAYKHEKKKRDGNV